MQWQPFFLPYNRQLHLRLSLNQKRDHIISFDEQETSVSLNGAGKSWEHPGDSLDRTEESCRQSPLSNQSSVHTESEAQLLIINFYTMGLSLK